jgi:tripartite-type tricarboxylate transporter receptor subunit TctC
MNLHLEVAPAVDRRVGHGMSPWLTCILVGAALSLAWQPSFGESSVYPSRPIRLVIPSAAGGSPDTILRLLGNQLAKQTGQQFVLDNRPGGSYTIGTMVVAAAPPDGYTVGYGNLTSLTVNRYYLDQPPPYNIDKDITPVIQTHYQSNVLVVSPSLPIRSMSALIEYAKAHPGQLLYGSGGNGTSSHISAELFKFMSGTSIGHVPYKGSPQAIVDLMAGQIQMTFNNLVTLAPYIKNKRVNALAITGPKRSPLFPGLPTVAESGMPNYEFSVWGGLIAPARTPKEIIARLNAEINKAFELQAIKDEFDALGNTLVGGSPAQFEKFIAAENRKWEPVIRHIKLKVD